MPGVQIKKLKNEVLNCKEEPFSKSLLILKHSQESCEAFMGAYNSSKQKRPGSATDEEQDLLRGMLVFALAGLDSMVKQLITDTLPSLVKCDDLVRSGLEKFIQRRLRDDRKGDSELDNKFLAKLLISESLQNAAIVEYVHHLTSNSLQSVEELMNAVFSLGLEPNTVGLSDTDELKPVFEARNQIIHELDIDFSAPRRNRIIRKQTDMVEYTNRILSICQKVFFEVLQKL